MTNNEKNKVIAIYLLNKVSEMLQETDPWLKDLLKKSVAEWKPLKEDGTPAYPLERNLDLVARTLSDLEVSIYDIIELLEDDED